jgi:hypothetical protein
MQVCWPAAPYILPGGLSPFFHAAQGRPGSPARLTQARSCRQAHAGWWRSAQEPTQPGDTTCQQQRSWCFRGTASMARHAHQSSAAFVGYELPLLAQVPSNSGQQRGCKHCHLPGPTSESCVYCSRQDSMVQKQCMDNVVEWYRCTALCAHVATRTCQCSLLAFLLPCRSHTPWASRVPLLQPAALCGPLAQGRRRVSMPWVWWALGTLCCVW